MLATLGGLLALPLGLTVLLLPLLAPELSRPRDSAWGAVVLLLGLDLVTSADRLTGAPMLGVLCGALLIGRLGLEVAQARWRQLTEEERQRLGSRERWTSSFSQLGITTAGMVERAGAGIGNLTTGIGAIAGGGDRVQPLPEGQAGGAPSRSGGKSKGKRWVRPETPVAAPTTAGRAVGDAETNPGIQDEPRSDRARSRPATPATQVVEGAGRSKAVPIATIEAAPASPSALLPAPSGIDQAPEPTAAPETAPQATFTPEGDSGA
jgi:isoleucyl-tRNA synthetase